MVNNVANTNYSNYLFQHPQQTSGGQAIQQAQTMPQGPTEENRESMVSQRVENTTNGETREVRNGGIDTYV